MMRGFMKKFKAINNFVTIITIISFIIYPKYGLLQASSIEDNNTKRIEINKNSLSLTYDKILNLIDEIESGKIERKCSIIDIQKINYFITFLANKGVLENNFEEENELEKDIDELLHDQENIFEDISYLENSEEYKIVPTVFNVHDQYDIIYCGKISKQWKKTKKFVKKHKKEIIIGSAVVIVAAGVAIAIVASSAAAGTAAGAAGTAISSNISKSKDKSETRQEQNPSSITKDIPCSEINSNETPIINSVIDKHISNFKESLAKEKVKEVIESNKDVNEQSFKEKVREFGAYLSHQAYDELTELTYVVPQLFEEVKEIGSKLLPESLSTPNNELIGSPIENHKSLVSKGHKLIDSVFATDQSEFFTEEAKANNPINKFDIAIMPAPGVLPKNILNTNKLIKAGKVRDRAGFTKAGRGLMKHGYREGSEFPKPVGNPAQINAHGQKVLESIVNHPEKKYVFYESKRLGKTIDIYAPNIGGVRYSLKGDFIGFLELKK